MSERKSLSKRTRFEIFKRDGFRCIYCGATPQDLPLHVDHVVAVANGGTDDAPNLVTACRDCNGGKSAVPLEERRFKTGQITEADREHAEQLREYLSIQREVHAAKNEVGDQLLNAWEEHCGDPGNVRGLRTRLSRAASEFGYARVMEAIEITGQRDLDGPLEQVRYFHGILRKWRGIAPPEPVQAPPNPIAIACANAITAACAHIRGAARGLFTQEGAATFIAEQFLRANLCPEELVPRLARGSWGARGTAGMGMRVEHRDMENGGTRHEVVVDDEAHDPYRTAFATVVWDLLGAMERDDDYNPREPEFDELRAYVRDVHLVERWFSAYTAAIRRSQDVGF